MIEEKKINPNDIDYVGVGGILYQDDFERTLLDYLKDKKDYAKSVLSILVTEHEIYDYRIDQKLKKAVDFAKSNGFDEKDIKIDLYYHARRNIYANQDLTTLKTVMENLGYENIEAGVFECCHYSLEQAKKAFSYVRKSAREIKKLNLSPLETMLYLYVKIKHYSYNIESNDEHWATSRTLIGVVNSKFSRLVCAGYSRLLYSIATELNNPNIKIFENSIELKYSNGKLGHHRNDVVYLKDDKYNIEGFYYADATWDSSKHDSNSLRYFLLPLDDVSFFKDVCLITKINNGFSFSGETARNLYFNDMLYCLLESKKYRTLLKNAYYKLQDVKLGDNFERITNNYEIISECFDFLKLAGIRFLPKSNFLAKKACIGTITKDDANWFLQKEIARSDLEKTKDYVMLKVLDFMKAKINNCEANVNLSVVVWLRKYLDDDKEFVEKISAYGMDNFVNLLLIQDNFASFNEYDLRRVLTNFEEYLNEEVEYINKSYLERISTYNVVMKATNVSYADLRDFVRDYPNNVYKIMKSHSSEIHLKDIMDALYSIGKALSDKKDWSKVYKSVEKIVEQNISYASNVFENSIELKNPFAQAKFYDDKAWREKLGESEKQNDLTKEQ